MPLKIIHPKINYEYEPKQRFIDNQIIQAQKGFHPLNLDFEVINASPFEIIKNINPTILILDFIPILKRDYLKDINSHNTSC